MTFDGWDEFAAKICVGASILGLIAFFVVPSGQYLYLAATTGALALFLPWQVWKCLRSGEISVGRASFLLGACAPLVVVYAALIWVQQYQVNICADKFQQDIYTIACWMMCCLIAAGPAGLLGTCVGYVLTGTSWTLFERGAGRVLSCGKSDASLRGLKIHLEQPFLHRSDMRFIVVLTATSAVVFFAGLLTVLKGTALSYSGIGLVQSAAENAKQDAAAPRMKRRPAAAYRFEDPLSAE